MDMKRALAASFLVLLSACTAECSCGGDNDDDDDDTTSGQGGSGGQAITVTVGSGGNGTGGNGTGGAGTGGEGGGAPQTDAMVRLAHFSPDSAAVNVCLIDADGAEIGPLVEGGFEFGEYTEYAGVNSGTYGVALVAAGADDCGTPLAAFEGLEIGEDETLTVAAIGNAAGEDDDALTIIGFVDDTSAPEAGNVKARFVHAAVGAPDVDVGYYDEEDLFNPLWEGATYPSDAGYVNLPAFDTLDLVARAAGSDVDLLTQQVPGTDGSIVEGFAIGSPATGIQVLVIETPAE